MLDLHQADHDHEMRPATTAAVWYLRRAWWSVAMLPVAFLVATLVGNELLTLQGFDPDSGEKIPVGPALVSGVPATLILVVPALAAFLFGRRAMSEGESRGEIPSVVGAVLALYAVATGLLTLIFG